MIALSLFFRDDFDKSNWESCTLKIANPVVDGCVLLVDKRRKAGV
jgi:hypothetical protein